MQSTPFALSSTTWNAEDGREERVVWKWEKLVDIYREGHILKLSRTNLQMISPDVTTFLYQIELMVSERQIFFSERIFLCFSLWIERRNRFNRRESFSLAIRKRCFHSYSTPTRNPSRTNPRTSLSARISVQKKRFISFDCELRSIVGKRIILHGQKMGRFLQVSFAFLIHACSSLTEDRETNMTLTGYRRKAKRIKATNK